MNKNLFCGMASWLGKMGPRNLSPLSIMMLGGHRKENATFSLEMLYNCTTRNTTLFENKYLSKQIRHFSFTYVNKYNKYKLI